MELLTINGALRTENDLVRFFKRAKKVHTVDMMLENVLRRNDIVIPVETISNAISHVQANKMDKFLELFLRTALRRRNEILLSNEGKFLIPHETKDML